MMLTTPMSASSTNENVNSGRELVEPAYPFVHVRVSDRFVRDVDDVPEVGPPPGVLTIPIVIMHLTQRPHSYSCQSGVQDHASTAG